MRTRLDRSKITEITVRIPTIRFELLTAALTFAAALMAFPFSSDGADYVMKVSYETSDTHLKARTLAVFKKDLEESTGGKIEVQTFSNSSLLPSKQEVTAAIRGQVQGILPFISYYEAITPRAKLLTVPMIFRDYDHLARAMDGKPGKEIFADLEEKGLKPLGFWYETPTQIFISSKPVRTMADLKGLKIRTYPSATLEGTLSALGASPAVVAGSEVYLALKNGTVDGAVTTPSFAQSLKLTEVVKKMTDVNLVFGGYIFAANKQFYQSLPNDLRQRMDEAARRATEWNRKALNDEIAKSLADMQAAGVETIPLAPEERARWVQAVQPVIDNQEPMLQSMIKEVNGLK